MRHPPVLIVAFAVERKFEPLSKPVPPPACVTRGVSFDPWTAAPLAEAPEVLVRERVIFHFAEEQTRATTQVGGTQEMLME